MHSRESCVDVTVAGCFGVRASGRTALQSPASSAHLTTSSLTSSTLRSSFNETARTKASTCWKLATHSDVQYHPPSRSDSPVNILLTTTLFVAIDRAFQTD